MLNPSHAFIITLVFGGVILQIIVWQWISYNLLFCFRKENCYLIGYQSRNPEIRNKQKQSGKFPHEPAANVAKELPHSESIIGLSANAQREFQVAELASLQPTDLHGATADHVAELAAVSGIVPFEL